MDPDFSLRVISVTLFISKLMFPEMVSGSIFSMSSLFLCMYPHVFVCVCACIVRACMCVHIHVHVCERKPEVNFLGMGISH